VRRNGRQACGTRELYDRVGRCSLFGLIRLGNSRKCRIGIGHSLRNRSTYAGGYTFSRRDVKVNVIRVNSHQGVGECAGLRDKSDRGLALRSSQFS